MYHCVIRVLFEKLFFLDFIYRFYKEKDFADKIYIYFFKQIRKLNQTFFFILVCWVTLDIGHFFDYEENLTGTCIHTENCA